MSEPLASALRAFADDELDIGELRHAAQIDGSPFAQEVLKMLSVEGARSIRELRQHARSLTPPRHGPSASGRVGGRLVQGQPE